MSEVIRKVLFTSEPVAREILKLRTICQYIVKNKVIFKSDSYSACVMYSKTIIHLSAGGGTGY